MEVTVDLTATENQETCKEQKTVGQGLLGAIDLALGLADYATESAQKLARQWMERGGKRREMLTGRLQELTRRGSRLRLATREDIDRLSARLAALERTSHQES